MSRRALTATYRLQLSAAFTLHDARGRIPYLRRLGVSHLYCSPVLAARSGSTHGYDVADPTLVSQELGGDEALPGWSEEGAADPETLAVRRDEIHLVHRALEALPIAFREVLVLRELEDMSYKEVASVTGVPLGTVMSRLARGRKMLAGAVRAAQGGQDRPSVRLVRRAGAGHSEE